MNKKTTLALLTAGITAAVPAISFAQAPAEGERPARPERPEGGRPERPEGGRPERPEGGRGERGGGRGERGGVSGMMRFIPVLAALDADGNAELSAEEIKNATAALLTLDKNEDGKLDGEELRPAFGGRGGPGGGSAGGGSPEQTVSRIMAFDKNKDGKLTKDELSERMQGMLTRADLNKDGAATKEELLKMFQDRPQREGGGRRPEGQRNRPQRPPSE